MISRRRVLQIGGAAAAALPFEAHANSSILGLFARGRAAAYFTNGITENSYPAMAQNSVPPGTFPPSAPANLNLPWWATSWFFSVWMNSINPPYTGGTHPLFGLQMGEGEVFSVRLLPWYNASTRSNAWPIFPYISNGQFTALQADPAQSVLEIIAQNPFFPQNATKFFAVVDTPYTGEWKQIRLSYNPTNSSPGTMPANAQVAIATYGQPNSRAYTAYLSPAGGQRAQPLLQSIPVGDAFGNGNPTAWLAFQAPYNGGDPGQTWAQNNSFQGSLSQVIADFGTNSNPFPGVYLNAIDNSQSLMTGEGIGKWIPLRQLTLPNGAPAHEPTVLLQGGVQPLSRPEFLRNSLLYIDTSPNFVTPQGYVDIQDITIQEDEEGRTIGSPIGGEDN